jgi:hypothetical protein
MRTHAKLMLFGLFLVLGLTWASEAWAFIPSGGSRLLYYFSKRSFSAGAGDNTAQTLLFITNTHESAATRIGIKHYRADCGASTATVFQPIGAGQTLRIDVATQTPASYQEGVSEVFFVNNSDQPIRWDRGTGSSIVIDLPIATVVRLPAALLHSDDRTGSGAIAAPNNGTTWAPLLLSGNFADPDIVTTRLAVFAPGTNSGSVSGDRTIDVDFRAESAGSAATVPFDAQCGRTQTLPQVRGLSAAAFQAAYPQGGVVAPQVDGQDKGIVGWLIEVIQLGGGIDILFGQILQGFGTVSESAHP